MHTSLFKYIKQQQNSIYSHKHHVFSNEPHNDINTIRINKRCTRRTQDSRGERENGSYQTRGRRACIAADTGRLVDRKTGGWYLNARSPSNGARIALSQSDMLITSCQLSVIGPAHNVDLLENGGTWRRIAFCHDPSIVSPSPIFVRSNSIVREKGGSWNFWFIWRRGVAKMKRVLSVFQFGKFRCEILLCVWSIFWKYWIFEVYVIFIDRRIFKDLLDWEMLKFWSEGVFRMKEELNLELQQWVRRGEGRIIYVTFLSKKVIRDK